MGKGIKEPAGGHELEPVSLTELIHRHVRAAIEAAVREELQVALGTTPYKRHGSRRGYRNGIRERKLTGPTGPVALALPRATLFRRRRCERMDLDDRPALSATHAAGE
jgi:transposase-like protein